MLGGGENIFLDILSWIDIFLEIIKHPMVVVFDLKFVGVASVKIMLFSSFFPLSSSETLKNIGVSLEFSIQLMIVGVDKKTIKRNKKKRATNFIETKINLKKYK